MKWINGLFKIWKTAKSVNSAHFDSIMFKKYRALEQLALKNYTHDMSGSGDPSRTILDWRAVQLAAAWQGYYAIKGNLHVYGILQSDPVAVDIGVAQRILPTEQLRIVHIYGERYASAVRDYYSQFDTSQ